MASVTKEREFDDVDTRSVWDFLANNPYNFCNLLYHPRNEVLWPKFEVRDLLLWQDVYVSEQGRGGAVVTGAATEVVTPGSNKVPKSGKEIWCDDR
jgi:hypothetical protein